MYGSQSEYKKTDWMEQKWVTVLGDLLQYYLVSYHTVDYVSLVK